jgi:serine/threonine-protein kinase
MSDTSVDGSMFGFPDEETAMHGKYRLLAELGKGGTAIVCLAVARGPSGFNKLVVLKFLKGELAAEPEFRRMFLNEARLAARLNHPNVVQTYEVFEEAGRPIIVMEYLEGAPLSRIISRAREQGRPIPLTMHLRIISETLNGLHYSHELCDYDGTPLGVVHRDMSPQNIFVSFSGKITLLDFGIAKLTYSIAETQTGVLKGKLRYMPPEQILGETVDGRTDIFAVGVMLWEALAREKMWRGVSDANIMYNILNGAIPSPRTLRPEVPQALERICMKALATDPNHRYATAAELQDDLEDWLTGHTFTNRTIGEFVDSLFADERAKTHEIIERQLASVEADAPPDSKPVDSGTVRVPRLRQAHSDPSPSDVPPADVHQAKGSMVAWLALPALALGALLLGRTVWKQSPSLRLPLNLPVELPVASPPLASPPVPNPPAASPPAARSPAVPENPVPSSEPLPVPPPQAAAESKTFTLKITAFPAKAKLYLDERPLPSNPYSGSVQEDSGEHSIRAEALGFVTDRRGIAYDQDRELMLRLVPLRPGVRWQPPVHPPIPVPAPTAPAIVAPPIPAPPKENCTPPYYIDENGIRRLKAKCLSSLGE